MKAKKELGRRERKGRMTGRMAGKPEGGRKGGVLFVLV